MVIKDNINYDLMKKKIDYIKTYEFSVKDNCCGKHPFYKLKEFPKHDHSECFFHKIFKNEVLKLIIQYKGNIKAIGRAIGNAANYGKPPYYIKLFIGNKGYFIIITDSGTGFDYKEIIRKKNNMIKYWHNGGGGFKSYCRNDIEVSFDKNGREIILLYIKKDIS